MSSLEEIRAEFIHLYEDMFSRRDLPPIMGRIVAVFLLEERELTQQELSELVGYSVSSVNRALDEMTRRGMFSRRKDTRSLRQYVYRMNLDMRDMVGGALRVLVGTTTASIEKFRTFVNSIDLHKTTKDNSSELRRIKAILKKNEEYLVSLLQILEDVIEKLSYH